MKRSVPSAFNELSDSEPEVVIKKVKKKAVKLPADSAEVDYEHFDLPLESTTTDNAESKLQTSLFETNKLSIGLSIMEKMGFKVGDSLGASSSSTSITTPIVVEKKVDKGGIGQRKDNLKDLDHSVVSKSYSEKKIKLQVLKLQEFCFRASGDFDEMVEKKGNLGDIDVLWRDYAVEFSNNETIKRSQRTRTDIFSQNLQPTPKEVQVNDDMEPAKKLVLLLERVRKEYFYCLYCGCVYNDKQDLLDNCPGIEEEAHAAVS